ncbi:response regulator [Pseudomonas sp. F1_0610]|uniref:response regulator n=1 Tax=Pseudomonas sp. F1_0610 TaxID=3114284 RepID=UPI0039C2D632
MRILLVEDHQDLAKNICQFLQTNGLSVDCLDNGRSAEMLLRTELYDVVILDIGLPYLDGFSVLRGLRQHNSHTAVLILSARNDVQDRVLGLDLGADDYLAKPFDLTELLARIRALLRRNLEISEHSLYCGDLSYNLSTQVFLLKNQRLILTSHQHNLLRTLISRTGRILNKEQLVNSVFGLDNEASPEAIELHIHRLRKKLEQSNVQIVTFRGIGYMLESKNEKN